MFYRLLTDLVVTIHFAFLLFVVGGGVLARRYRWVIPVHLLAAAWGVYVEARPGLICPLTPLESALAVRAGGAGYSGSFIEHYLVPIITRTVSRAPPNGCSRRSWSSLTWRCTCGRGGESTLVRSSGRRVCPHAA